MRSRETFFTVEIGTDSIIIVRDDDMKINAFHNVCRHRGARLRNAGSGIVGNLVCPYHSWTYNLCGELIHNEHMGENFDRSQFSLKSVHVRSLAGLHLHLPGRNSAGRFRGHAHGAGAVHRAA